MGGDEFGVVGLGIVGGPLIFQAEDGGIETAAVRFAGERPDDRGDAATVSRQPGGDMDDVEHYGETLRWARFSATKRHKMHMIQRQHEEILGSVLI